MSRRAYDAVVVGAGHNGLVTAAYLARAGLGVCVLERRGEAGGLLGTAEIAPGLPAPIAPDAGRLGRTVVRDLSLARLGLSLIRPAVRAYRPGLDGPPLTLWADPARTSEGLRAVSKADASAYPEFDARVRSLASWVARLNATIPPDLTAPSLGDAISGLKLGKALRGLGGPRQSREILRVLPMAVADLTGEAFETDALRGLIAARGVRYAAAGPWSAGTAAVLLNDSANGGGAAGEFALVRGGPAALAGALASAARAFGADVRTGASVTEITQRDGRVTGAVLEGGEEVPARIVVSGADPRRTLGLIDPAALGPELVWRGSNVRMPGAVAWVGLVLAAPPRFVSGDGVVEDERLAGRIVMTGGIDDLERAFDASKYGRVSAPPHLEATIPTIADPSLAPEGTHLMSVLVQWTPYRRGDGDWDSEREVLGDAVVKRLEEFAPGLSAAVTSRRVLTPLDLERDYGLTEGHPLHGEPLLDQFFAWRPILGQAGYRFALDGLYLCGSGAHPGGGVTGAPGANAARRILSEVRSRGSKGRFVHAKPGLRAGTARPTKG